ncbi:unnamed protein product [Adineta ricciae]|uniref:G-protein coupled receptors family 1 profile domain-containing protein n=1 Tax=Adineta ricciae TaxID=249248 RepID=A0A813TFM4_ADIRI|nr:unnamed protein product [Adineta ricciae]CAF0811793.1 unnamed protein product [Adineta ricciae]
MGCLGNVLCICVFLRKRFRSSLLTPFFVTLLVVDCIYLNFRVIKLLYYQDTLFQQFLFQSSCSSTFFIKIYAYFSQSAPQIFIPLCHYELYIRFSLILMSCLAIQRAYDMGRTSFRLIQRNSSSRSFAFVIIFIAFLSAYILEFFGLSIFCSVTLSSTTAYQWYDYLYKHFPNETNLLMSFMQSNSASQYEIDCLINNRSACSYEEVERIAPTLNSKMARNELRLKYHYHTCLVRLQPDLFLNLYDLLYSRVLAFNRYTIILVIGSIIPSILTILSNAISLRWILNIRNSVHKQSAVFHRTAETHRVILIITIECLLSVINSWLVDIILSINFCHRSVAIGDDCPDFLRRYHPFLAFFDLLNSMSNILLYCYAAKRFRHELERMLKGWIHPIRQHLSCYCQWQHSKVRRKNYEEEPNTLPSEVSVHVSKPSKQRSSKKYEYIKLKLVSTPNAPQRL